MDFRVGELPRSTVFNLYLDRGDIWLDPPYQRAGDIWGLEKRQLLIDSILNGFDIPKFYLHEFFPAAEIDGKIYKYAIVDGRQRLSALWDFIDGAFPLADDTELINQPDIDVSGFTYTELGKEYPRLQARFDSSSLTVVTIQTTETELIEEMFSRLNEAVPLSAAEKRNALRGPLPPIIRRIAQEHAFLRRSLPFNNSRYRHYDLSCKFLYLEHKGELSDLKKPYLDGFVVDFRERDADDEAATLEEATTEVLERLATVFTDADPLLRSVGMVTLYYWLFSCAVDEGNEDELNRRTLASFEDARSSNRRIAEENVRRADYDLLEFDRLAQSPNDGVALDFRYGVLANFIANAK